jgi:hypothetical protein
LHLSQTDALFGYACAVLRPQWNGIKVTGLGEAITLASSHVSILLLVLAGLALWRRIIWITSLLCLSWVWWGGWHIFGLELLDDSVFSAIKIGCIGHSQTYLIAGTLICALPIAATYLAPRRTHAA